MPAPGSATYSAAAKVAAQTSFRDLLDAGSNALVRIRNSADTLLWQGACSDPCGTVNGTTGQLTITMSTNPNATASGTAAYGELCESDGTVHLSLPVEAGTSPVSGKLVINTLSIVSGAPVTMVSLTIG